MESNMRVMDGRKQLLFESWIEIVVPTLSYLLRVSERTVLSQLCERSSYLRPVVRLLFRAERKKEGE